VTAMLVNRYFGSKELLFAEVMTEIMAAPTILTPQLLASGSRGADMAAALVGITKSHDTPLDGFLIMMRSASNERAAHIAREQIEKCYHKTLTGALSGDLASQRAAVVLSIVAGFQGMRQMIGLSALAKAEPAALMRLLTPLFTQLLEGEYVHKKKSD
jgi:AcrR family transcriptional regulator